MAAVTVNKSVAIPMGDRFLFVVEIDGTSTGIAAANEWVDGSAIGCSHVDYVIGYLKTGGGASTATSVQINAQGTGVAEGTNPGDVGVESASASAEYTLSFVGRGVGRSQ